jgi:hypothetical protein
VEENFGAGGGSFDGLSTWKIIVGGMEYGVENHIEATYLRHEGKRSSTIT